MKIKFIPVAAFLVLASLASKEALAASPSSSTFASINTSPIDYNRDAVLAIVVYIVSDLTETAIEEIEETDLIMNDLGMSSLNMLQLIMECIDFFEINFNIADALYYSDKYTIGTFTNMIYHFCHSDEDYTS